MRYGLFKFETIDSTQTAGFKAIKLLWLSRALDLNKPITVSYDNKHKHGIFLWH